jgi:hypothetical protein
LASWPETPLLTAKWARAKGVGVFSDMLISYPHLYPRFGVAGTTFTGERGSVPTRGYDEVRRAGEGDERRIKLRFQVPGAVECDSCMRNHTRRYFS